MAGLVLEHVRKRYGDHEVIPDLSLEVRDREFFVILGESGAGKTTMLKMIAGVEAVTAGTILLDGRPIQDLPPEQRDCAMVFETYALYSHLSVYENLAFGLRAPRRRLAQDASGVGRLRGWFRQTSIGGRQRRPTPDATETSIATATVRRSTEIHESVLRVARLLGIDPYLDRKPGALSGGQRQRVALGRALVRRPAVFLMDEPLSHLDARLRNQMRTEIKTMRESFGTTIIYVTHDYREALALGDRIAILHQGRIEQVGTPAEVYRRPRNRLVAESLGDPPMNFLPGTLIRGQDRWSFETPICRIPLPAGPRLDANAGQEVCLGIRPQHLRLERARPDTAFSLQARVFVHELLGEHAVVSASVADQLFMALCPADQTYAMDEPVHLTWAPEHMYLFRTDTGATLLGGDE